MHTQIIDYYTQWRHLLCSCNISKRITSCLICNVTPARYIRQMQTSYVPVYTWTY